MCSRWCLFERIRKNNRSRLQHGILSKLEYFYVLQLLYSVTDACWYSSVLSFQNVLYLFNYFLDPQISCWGFKGALDIWGWYVRHHRLLHRAAANLLWVQTLLSIFGRPNVTADWAPVVQYYGNPFQTGRFRANRVGSWWMLPCNGWVNDITVTKSRFVSWPAWICEKAPLVPPLIIDS